MVATLEITTESSPLSTKEFVDRLSHIAARGAGVLDYSSVSLTLDGMLDLLENGPLRVLPSSDGLVSEVHEEQVRGDFSKQSGNFDFHTDGLAYDSVPEFVLLYCAHPGAGASDTLIADSRLVCQRLSNAELSLLAQCETEYVGKTGDTIRHRLLVDHPQSGEPVLNLGTRGLLRPWLTPEQALESPSLRYVVRTATKLYDLIDESIVCRHRWKQGDALFIDNYTYLHARSALSLDPGRRLLRVWLSRS